MGGKNTENNCLISNLRINQPITAFLDLRWEGSRDRNSNFADARARPARGPVQPRSRDFEPLPTPNLRTRARGQRAVLRRPVPEILTPCTFLSMKPEWSERGCLGFWQSRKDALCTSPQAIFRWIPGPVDPVGNAFL